MGTVILVASIFVIGLLSNLPVAVVIGGLGVFAIVSFDIPAVMIIQRMILGLDNSSLAAVLFFMLGGEIMNAGGITKRLAMVLLILFHRIRGAMAYVTVLVNMILAGVSGSATADAVATGAVFIPMMKDNGYSASFSAVLVATSATMGPLIPPSILFIIIGSMCNVSILGLLLGGALPGVLLAISLLVISYIICKKRGYGIVREEQLKEAKAERIGFRLLMEFILALLMPVLILGGMRVGLFTPTEAGVVLVVYSLILSCLVYRELKLKDLAKVIINSALFSANVLFIMAVAAIIGYVVVRMDLIEYLATLTKVYFHTKISFLLMVNAFLLVLGCLMEITVVAIILSPVLIPLAVTYGVDPIEMGVIIVFNLMIGLITPPVGMNMYITCRIAEISVWKFAKEAVPFVIVMIMCLIFVSYVPGFLMLLPNLVK